MKETQTRLTPIDSVDLKSKRLNICIPFPSWVEKENIGVDIKRTERLMQLGGIRRTNVRGVLGNSNWEGDIVVAGVDSGGVAYSGKARVKKEKLYESRLRQCTNSSQLIRNSNWIDLDLEVNLQEVQGRIQNREGALKEADNWTPELDHILRSGIREAGIDNLLGGHTKLQGIMAAYINIYGTFMSSAGITPSMIFEKSNPHVPATNDLIMCIAYSCCLWTIAGSAVFGRENKGQGYRISLFPGYEVDRGAALQILSRMQKVVQSIEGCSNTRRSFS